MARSKDMILQGGKHHEKLAPLAHDDLTQGVAALEGKEGWPRFRVVSRSTGEEDFYQLAPATRIDGRVAAYVMDRGEYERDDLWGGHPPTRRTIYID